MESAGVPRVGMRLPGLRRAWQALRTAAPSQQLYWGALALLLVLGTFLRLNGHLGRPISFWLDEALWAPRFVEKPLLSFGIRPIGFVWLTRTLVGLFDASEVWFRFLPNIGGLVSLWLMPYVASRLLESRALRVLLVLLFALHPGLIDLSKEFKPYSFEVLVHLVTIVLYLRYEQTRRLGYLWALLGYLPVAFVMAYNVAFALPGLLLLALWTTIKRRERAPIVAVLVSGIVCGAVVFAVHHYALSRVEKGGRTETYWGKKYDLFYLASKAPPEAPDEEAAPPVEGQEAPQSRASWTLEKSADMASMIGLRRELWNNRGQLSERTLGWLMASDRWLWIALSLLGVAFVLHKRREQALLWLTPLLVLGVVNAMGKWPLGQFRTNLFTVVYLFPLPLFGLAWLASFGRWLFGGASVAVLLISVLPGFLFGFDAHGHKRIWCRDGYGREIIPALYKLREQQQAAQPSSARARLLLDLFSYKVCSYYLSLHPQLSRQYSDFDRYFRREEVGSRRLVEQLKVRLKQRKPVYVVATKARSARALTAFAESGARVLQQVRIADDVIVMVVDD